MVLPSLLSLLVSGVSPSLTPAKGEGNVGIQISYQRSMDFYDVDGNRQSVFSDGHTENYEDLNFNIRSEYGITDRAALWLLFPLVYRRELDFYQASNWGIGDVQMGARYRFYNSDTFEAAFETRGKVPSGSTDFDFPLGKGTSSLTPEVLFQERMGIVTLRQRAGYSFSFASEVEYLRSSLSAGQQYSNGTLILLPGANQRIDFGDEIQAGLHGMVDLLSILRLDVGADYLYRRSTTVTDFGVDSSGAFVPIITETSHGEFFYISPGLELQLHPVSIRAGAILPLWGKNYPTLPLVESMIGNSYSFEIRHDF